MTNVGVLPSWLTILPDKPAPWGWLPLDQDAADEFLALVSWLWEQPAFRDLCERWSKDLAAGKLLQTIEWRRLSADSLVSIATRLRGDRAVAAYTFLPRPYRERISIEVRAYLYTIFVPVSVVLALFLMDAETPADIGSGSSLVRSVRGALNPDAPRTVFSPLARLWLSGARPLAMAEIARRGWEHPAGYAATVLLAGMNERADEDTDRALAARADAAALAALRRITGRRNRGILRALQGDMMPDPSQPRWTEELDVQTVLTLVDRLGNLDLSALLIQALEGRLDFIPMAVRSDLIDRFRHHTVIQKVEVPLPEDPTGDQRDERRRATEVPRSAEPDPDAALTQAAEKREHERIRMAIEAEPIYQTMVRAIQDGVTTQKDVAARCGVSDRTVRSWFEHLGRVSRRKTGH